VAAISRSDAPLATILAISASRAEVQVRDAADQLDATHPRHARVHQRDVDALGAEQGQRRMGVRGLADDRDARLDVE
jgi:hypothetical protein